MLRQQFTRLFRWALACVDLAGLGRDHRSYQRQLVTSRTPRKELTAASRHLQQRGLYGGQDHFKPAALTLLRVDTELPGEGLNDGLAQR